MSDIYLFLVDTRGTVQLTAYGGQPGINGVGVPLGGNTNQVLVKTSNANYTTGWATPRLVTTVSGSLTGNVGPFEFVYLLASGAAYVQPAANANFGRYTIKNTTASNISIARSGSDTLEGGTTLTIGPLASVELVSDGTSAYWVI